MGTAQDLIVDSNPGSASDFAAGYMYLGELFLESGPLPLADPGGPGGPGAPCPQDFFQNHAVFRQL